MMGVGEGDESEERLVFALTRAQIVDGAVADVSGRVEVFGDGCAVGLRAGIIVREFVAWVVQGFPVRRMLPEPLQVMPAAAVPCSVTISTCW